MAKTRSTLSKKRRLITLGLCAAVPLAARFTNIWAQQYDISLMFTMNAGTAALIMYDWNLFAIHYNRAKNNLHDTILFGLLAAVVLFIWTWTAVSFLSCRIILPTEQILLSYGYARCGMYIAYSFCESAMISLFFKALTDGFPIKEKEVQVILFSGLICGIVLTFLFLPSTNILTILTTMLYNVVLMTILSYFYNQTHSFFPGMIGFTLCNLLIMLI